MSQAQFDDFQDQRNEKDEFVAVFKDKDNHVIDGIEIKTSEQDIYSINDVATKHAQDLMAERGMSEVEVEIRKK
ncbi:hypothetical protein R4Z10_09230 [Niallia sp. XMNu-256]|uniref:hypothetical protein n=1 Tax=Niallia sp. XMNu-256 TaxID=3082444 RepID=UPI0030D44BFA